MAWTSTDADNLRAAIATGLLTVSYDGPPRRSLTYQSLSEMRALLASMEQAISGAAGKASYRLAKTSKGV